VTRATNIAKDRLCRACFDGIYPIPLPEGEELTKSLLEMSTDTVVHPGVPSRP
jgi:amidophosphoribosyltransferase